MRQNTKNYKLHQCDIIYGRPLRKPHAVFHLKENRHGTGHAMFVGNNMRAFDLDIPLNATLHETKNRICIALKSTLKVATICVQLTQHMCIFNE